MCVCRPDVCRQLALRQPPLGVPIILVSALAEESSVVSGLDSGADDYVIKPFRRAEFLARIRGKLQLANAGEAARQVRGVGVGVGARPLVQQCMQVWKDVVRGDCLSETESA